MSKKILSVVLALVLVMTTFAVSAFAVGGTGYEDDSTKTQTWALENERDNGDGTWSVDVRLTANYVVGAISFQVTNPDAEDGKLVGATLKSVTKGAALTYGANIQKNSTTGLVVIIPEPADETENGVDLTNGGIVATLTFTLTAESADIAIINDPKSEDNKGGDLIAVRLSDNNLTTATWIYGQTVTSVGETKTLGASAESVFQVIEGTNGVIDEDYMCVYGIDVMDMGETIADVFEVTEGGYIEVTPSVEGVEEGTGAILTAYTAGGDVIGEYTVVIHGDVNGDGASDSLDASLLCEYEIGFLADFSDYNISDEIAMLAGDVNADGGADSLDASLICEFEIGFLDMIFDITTLPQELYEIW